MDQQRLIQILHQSPHVDSVALKSATLEFERWGNDLVRCLLDKRGVSEKALVPLLSQYWGVPGVMLNQNYRPSHQLIELLSPAIADQHRAIPLRVEGTFIDIAFDHPSPEAIDAVRVHTRRNVRPHVTSPRTVDRLLSKYYGRMNIGGYQVDPRVTSGNFLSSDVVDLEVGEASLAIPVDTSAFEESPQVSSNDLEQLQESLDRAEQRIQLLEAHVARDQDVLRRLFGYLVDKGVGSREEIVALLS